MSENILLVSEDNSNAEGIFSGVSVIRRNKTLGVVSLISLKRALCENIKLVFINEKEYSHEEIIKTVDFIKRVSPDTCIILILSKYDENFITECYEKGVFDFINTDSYPWEYNLKILNCFKFLSIIQKSHILTLFLNSTSSINSKTGLFTHKSVKENFSYIRDFSFFKTGSYVIISIDTNLKTKVSMERLGLNLRQYLRQTDIIAQGTGKYYLLLPDTGLNGAKCVVEKIAGCMGNDIKIHAGISTFGIETFDNVEKEANDALKSAVINNKLYASLDENISVDENLDYHGAQNKHFKLFNNIYNKKLHDTIEPVFFRKEKELQAKFGDVRVNQYANKAESVFCIKCNEKQSKLIICYDGFAKFILKIVHLGLNSCENTQVEIPLNELTDKLLLKYLDTLYNEFWNSGIMGLK